MNGTHPLRSLVAAFCFVATALTSALAHADLFVISHPSTRIAASDIKDIYRGEKQFAGDLRLIPVDNGPAQDAFLETVLGVDAPRYNTIWTKKSFRQGLNPPPVKSGDIEVLQFVRKTPGAVGYISSLPSGVNIIGKY